jgi:hypothetical protein
MTSLLKGLISDIDHEEPGTDEVSARLVPVLIAEQLTANFHVA